MVPILSPWEISFIFPLLEKSYFALVVSKKLCLKASQMDVAVWTSSGFILSLKWYLINLPTEVYDGDWGGGPRNNVCLKVTFGFIFHKNLKGWLSGQVVQETKGTSASTVYTTRTAEMPDFYPQWVRHSFQSPDPESSKGTQRLLWLLSGRDIWFKCVYIRHKALVCEVGYSHFLWLNIKGMDWELKVRRKNELLFAKKEHNKCHYIKQKLNTDHKYSWRSRRCKFGCP